MPVALTAFSIFPKEVSMEKIADLLAEMKIPDDFVQYAIIDTDAMVSRITKECNVQGTVEWPLIFCNGIPTGTVENTRNWYRDNQANIESSGSLSSSAEAKSLLFRSFEYSSEINGLREIQGSQEPWSPVSSVNTEYLLSSIPTPRIPKKSRPQATQTTEESQPKAEILDVGLFSKVLDYIPTFSMFGGEQSDQEFPEETTLLAIPILRQNNFYKWNRRTLVMCETQFLRCSENVSDIRKRRKYSDIQLIVWYDESYFSVHFKNGEKEVYYTPLASEVIEIFISRDAAQINRLF